MKRMRRVFLSDSEDDPDPIPDLKGIYSDSSSDGEEHEDMPSLVFSDAGEDSDEDDDFVPTPGRKPVPNLHRNPMVKSQQPVNLKHLAKLLKIPNTSQSFPSPTGSRVAEDLTDAEFDIIDHFLNEACFWFYVGSENGDRELNLNAQGAAGSTHRTKMQLDPGLKSALGDTGLNHSYWNICVEPLNGAGIHTKLGMLGYCRKNHKSPNFADWKKNVTPEMEHEVDDLYLVLGKGDLMGCCELTENNMLMAKVDMFRHFKMKRGFPSFKSTVLRMFNSGRYFFSSTRFVIERRGLSEPRLESLWRSIILPGKCRGAGYRERTVSL
eukprot:gene3702-biopygen3638